MPAFELDDMAIHIPEAESIGQFTPVTKEHILNCSYDKWYPRYKAFCPPSKIITLPPDFISYLSEDGIVLADEDAQGQDADEDDWEPQNPSAHYQADTDDQESASDSDSDENVAPRPPPNKRFAAVHQLIKDSIHDLGGAVAPKLNWSAPKDATYMAFGNDMKCMTPNDIYLLLKSSSFVSHDLDQPFEGCALSQQQDFTTTITTSALSFQPVLVLRKFLDIRTAMEFRCFVKHRNLVAMTPRDMKHYDFQEKLRPVILSRARELFNARLRYNFPDSRFVFDMYIPDSHLDDSGLGRARLIDINPWAPTTDSLLFDWRELLQLRVAKPILGTAGEEIGKDDDQETAGDDDDEDDESSEEEDEDDFDPEFRLVEKQDARFNMMAADYSAHKLPKEVVDASMAGPGGLRDFMQQWQQLVDSGSMRR